MKKFVYLIFPLFCMTTEIQANEYPTIDIVRSVVECMAELGEQNEQNLYVCTCRHDLIAGEIAFEDYERARFFERYKQMPGKRGGLVRDSKDGEKLVADLQAAREKASKECPVVKNIVTPPKRDE